MSNKEALSCEHGNWQVVGRNTVGFGECLDCGREIPLPVLFESLRRKMEAALGLVKVTSLDVTADSLIVIEYEKGAIEPGILEGLRVSLIKFGIKRAFFIPTIAGQGGLIFTALRNVESAALIGVRHEE